MDINEALKKGNVKVTNLENGLDPMRIYYIKQDGEGLSLMSRPVLFDVEIGVLRDPDKPDEVLFHNFKHAASLKHYLKPDDVFASAMTDLDMQEETLPKLRKSLNDLIKIYRKQDKKKKN